MDQTNGWIEKMINNLIDNENDHIESGTELV